jgi:FlaA1/EpsC-like NDP-sugar epimerase
VTHKNITRYFMTIPEAAQLVIQAGALAKGGEVFVLDMGEPVRIIDLATKMVQLSGLAPFFRGSGDDGDIAVEVTGLRPGEKLYEELAYDDKLLATSHPRIMSADENAMGAAELEILLEKIERSITQNDEKSISRIFASITPDVASDKQTTDAVYAQVGDGNNVGTLDGNVEVVSQG